MCEEYTSLDGAEVKFWLALVRAPQIGAVTFNALLESVGSPPSIFQESRQALSKLGLSDRSIRYILNPDWQAVNRDLDWLEHPDHHALTLRDSHYPQLLKEIAVPPPILFVNGDVSIVSSPQIAMVGSRNPSPLGKKTAFDFAALLSDVGICITSGLALGIDAASHAGAMVNKGATVAVTGTGLDRVYPARHKHLAHEIVCQGALVSEFPLGSLPKANHFPRRNRIISGLSLGTLVVEAAERSGSLITARHALEQGREVFAIPGSIHNPLARGCNALIREGAKLVETANDVLEELQQFSVVEKIEKSGSEITGELEEEYRYILKYVAYSPTSIDTLVRETGELPEVVASTLLVLELGGYVQSISGGCYCRLK